MSSDKLEKSLSPLEKLAKEEDEAYREWRRRKEAHLPLAQALKMYELYLNGYSCEEIFKVNGQKFPIGQIVDAKIRYEWDERKEAQIASLYAKVEEKVLFVKNEAVSHLADLMAAAHKIWGARIGRFLQDGDMTLIEGFDPSTLKNYKEILGMMQELTTAQKLPKTNEVKVNGTVNHVYDAKASKMNSSSASDLLKVIDGDVQEK
jgi:hypothetical protein